MSTPYDPSRSDPARPVYIPVAVPSRPGPLVRLFNFFQWCLVVMVVLALIGLAFNSDRLQTDADDKLQERYHSLDKKGTLKVAIVEVEGAILSGDDVKKQIEMVRNDPEVKAVVLRVDSPGGTVTASDYIYHHLRKLTTERKLPLVVSMGGMAASGGYYVAMACGDAQNVIFAEPTTWTGSIGVIIPHYNVAGLMETLKIDEDSIKSGPLKQVGSFTKKMTPEERAVLESLVADSFARFKDIVLAGRPKLRNDQDTLAKATTGQVFTAQQAVKLGLVDKEGFLEDAIDRALELASLDKSTTKVVRYHRPESLVESLVGLQARTPAGDLRTLLDLATPRAYYLFAVPGAEVRR